MMIELLNFDPSYIGYGGWDMMAGAIGFLVTIITWSDKWERERGLARSNY
jgi:hypothetical protein